MGADSAPWILLVEDRSGPRYRVVEDSDVRYGIQSTSEVRYRVVEDSDVRYGVRSQGDERLLLKGSPDDGSGTLSFTGDTCDSTLWHCDGSWIP